MPLKALILVSIFSILSFALLSYDALMMLLARRRRRRSARGGAYGVVVDRDGRVRGTYVDPFGHPWRAARMHGPESPWAPPVAFGESARVWEGFGETEEDAFLAATRLRRRHLQLLPLIGELDDDDGGDDLLRTLGRPS
jgi:hypothetical protein